MDYPYDLGPYFESISAGCDEPQRWFNRGMMWLYGFDLDSAYKCFGQAAQLSPNFALAYWGLAYASGFYYNMPWSRMSQAELERNLKRNRQHAREALAKIEFASERDASLIKALQFRCQADTVPADCSAYDRWNDEYADEMRKVYAAHPDDDDIATLFADALITRTPWLLWDLSTGEPNPGASTTEAIEALEIALARREQANRVPHPGMLHMYIHCMEMSKFPEKAKRAADQLRTLVPHIGHFCHMPSHIDVRCGHYREGVAASDRAIRADAVYIENEGLLTRQVTSRVHNFHMKVYAAMFLGQFQTALDAAEGLRGTVPDELLTDNAEAANQIEAYISIKTHVYIRFGRWQEIIDHPLPSDPALFSMTTAIWHYAKGIAHAVRNEIDAAQAEQKKFQVAVNRVPPTRYLFFNSCQDLLQIAAQMLSGELQYRRGNYEAAFAALRKAVYLDDHLKYDEPWGWMQPTRHALGALLLERGHIEQAKQIYMDDLGLSDTLVSTSHHIENLWSLHGLVECLERLGDAAHAKQLRARLERAISWADIPIHASCACRLEHYGGAS